MLIAKKLWPAVLGLSLIACGSPQLDESEVDDGELSVDDEKADNGTGCVKPSQETVEKGTYQPLSRPLFIYVKKASAGTPIIEAFVRFYIEQAGALSKEVGYIPFPADAYGLLQKRFEAHKTGTLFGEGSNVGITITELLEREQ